MSKPTTNPKGAGRKLLPEIKSRTALQINESTIKSIKVIAALDGTSITDVINAALKDHILKWEAKNGPIPKK